MKKRKSDDPTKKLILGIAIALVSVFFVVYLIQSIYPAPRFDDFCTYDSPRLINDSKTCEENNGFWEEGNKYDSLSGYCNINYYCRQEYEEESFNYEKHLFVINLSLGVIVLFLSFLFVKNTVSTGLFGGGIILILYGTLRHWSDLSNFLRAIMLGLTLAILIWISYKKLK